MVRQYVGARYVPKFANPVEWAANTSYEALTIVTFNNASYTSKIQVPPTVGNPANNPKYWALTGNYNAQVEQYRQETEGYKTEVEGYRQDAENYKTQVDGYKQELDTYKENTKKIYLNPYDFGFKGDNESDETDAIQATIDAAEALVTRETINKVPSFWGAPVVVLPAGLIHISKSLNITKSIELCGCGIETRIRPTKSIDYIINVYDAEDITINEEHQMEGPCIHDLAIDGDYRRVNITSGIYLNHVDHAFIFKLWFWCIKGSAITYNGVRETIVNSIWTRWCGTVANATINMLKTDAGDSSNLNIFNNIYVIFPFGSAIASNGDDCTISNITIHGILSTLDISSYFPGETYTGDDLIRLTSASLRMSNATWSYAPNGKAFINLNESSAIIATVIGGGHYSYDANYTDYKLTNNSSIKFVDGSTVGIHVVCDDTSTADVSGITDSELAGNQCIISNSINQKLASRTIIGYSNQTPNSIEPASPAVDGINGFIWLRDHEQNSICNIHESGIYMNKRLAIYKSGTLVLPERFSYESAQLTGDNGQIWVDDSRLCVRIGGKNYYATLTPIS